MSHRYYVDIYIYGCVGPEAFFYHIFSGSIIFFNWLE